MLKSLSSRVVFQEVPNEVSLCIPVTGCKIGCLGCHSEQLWEDIGEPLLSYLDSQLNKYKNDVTCILFFGGDQDEKELCEALSFCKRYNMKTALYSGNNYIDSKLLYLLDFVKTGKWDYTLGGLDKEGTNQKFYSVNDGILTDKTYLFRRK